MGAASMDEQERARNIYGDALEAGRNMVEAFSDQLQIPVQVIDVLIMHFAQRFNLLISASIEEGLARGFAAYELRLRGERFNITNFDTDLSSGTARLMGEIKYSGSESAQPETQLATTTFDRRNDPGGSSSSSPPETMMITPTLTRRNAPGVSSSSRSATPQRTLMVNPAFTRLNEPGPAPSISQPRAFGPVRDIEKPRRTPRRQAALQNTDEGMPRGSGRSQAPKKKTDLLPIKEPFMAYAAGANDPYFVRQRPQEVLAF
jgi:hypothetical protein